MFTLREGARTLKFCEKLMEKAVGLTSRFDFVIRAAYARSKGLRRCMPSVLRRRAIDMLLQGLCFHYGLLANRAQCSIVTLAIECRLATKSAAGKLFIIRVIRALTFLTELGLITYRTEYDPFIEYYIPTDITFTPALFAIFDVSEDAVVAARRSRIEWENRQRKKQRLDALGMDELITKAWRFVCERFRSYQTEPRSRGIKHARMRRGANRERQDIATLVKRQLTHEVSERHFTVNCEAVEREMERRMKEHMIPSRNHDHSRLTTVPP